MRLAICIAIKNRCLQIVDADPPGTYDHIKGSIQLTPADDLNPPEHLENGQICIRPLQTMLISLRKIYKETDDWRVVLADFGSTDANLEEVCSEILRDKIPFTIHKVDESYFNRGGGLDRAAHIAKELGYDTLFFCDTDMYFTGRQVIDQAERVLKDGKIYYPICFSFTDPTHEQGYWRDTGLGMVFMRTIDYMTSQRWKNNRSWGWEDRVFYESLPPERIKRERGVGYFHQWHPNSIEFKTKEYEVKEFVKKRAIY